MTVQRSIFAEDNAGKRYPLMSAHGRNANRAKAKDPRSRRYLAAVWDSLLAAGLLLSFDTQLRIGAAAVGPGELCLVLWEIPVIFVVLLRTSLIVPRVFWELACFWAIFAMALGIGAINGVVLSDLQDAYLVAHDVVAYLLLASLTCLMILSLPGWRLARVEWLFVSFGSISLLLQAANTWGLFALPNVDPWYWATRVRGWCDNPDQLALLCIVIAGLALHLAERATTTSARLFAIASILIAAVFGWMTRSNAYTLVILFLVFLFGTFKLLRMIVAGDKKGHATILLSSLLMFLPAALVVPAVDHDLAGQVKAGLTQNLFRKEINDDFTLRIYLWKEAIYRGANAHMLGLGPGPHLEIPATILAGRRDPRQPLNQDHPKPGLAPNFETHSTILELFVQGGILAVADFLWLGITAFTRSIRGRHDGLATGLCSLAIFGCSGVIFRLPGVWFVICLALVSYAARRTASDPAFVAAGTGMRPLLVQRRTQAPA